MPPQTNIRLDPEIKTQAVAAADGRGVSLSRLIELALTAYLGGDTTSPQPAPTDAKLPQQIAELAARVDALESQLIPCCPSSPQPAPTDTTLPQAAPKQPSEKVRQGASTAPQVSQGLAGEYPKADGGRWLTTSQAVEVSRHWGGPGSIATLKRRGEDGELGEIGLRYCPHGTKRNDLASFEDLRWEG